MKKTVTILVFILLITGGAYADVVSEYLKISNEDDVRECLFFTINSPMRLSLPRRTSYRSKVSNIEKSVWAINYHETSNYDGTDLVVLSNNSLFVIENIWQSIRSMCVTKKIVANARWDKFTFEVKSVISNKLQCRIVGNNDKLRSVVEKFFTVVVEPRPDGVEFQIE